MNKTLPIVVLSLAMIVLISGCTIPGTTREVKVSSTDGLVINEFSSDITRYEDTEPISLYLEIENVGGTTAKDVNITIKGAPWDSMPNPTDELLVLEPPDLAPVPPVRSAGPSARTRNPIRHLPWVEYHVPVCAE